MSTRKELICICDQCGHRWLPESVKPLPARCAKCKSVLWNREPERRGPKPKKDRKTTGE
jgi:predicted Zn-ribbon and HTH transcriptional regulator